MRSCEAAGNTPNVLRHLRQLYSVASALRRAAPRQPVDAGCHRRETPTGRSAAALEFRCDHLLVTMALRKLSEEELELCKKAFAAFDRDGARTVPQARLSVLQAPAAGADRYSVQHDAAGQLLTQ